MPRNQRWRRFRKSNRTWDSPWLPALAGALGGTFAALAVAGVEATARGLAAFGDGSAAPFWAFLFGFVALAVPVLVVQYSAARVLREVRALINIRPLTGAHLLGADPWAMDASFAELLLTLVDEGHEQIVECGSGHSTVLIAERLEGHGRGHVTAIEHIEQFAERTRAWLRERKLDRRATVVFAPIGERQVGVRRVHWYSGDELEAALPERIDLLVVDGPPDKIGKDARWPALPLLRDRLGPGSVIVMDDGDRTDERRAAFDWQERLGARMRYVPGGKGGWILRIPR